MNTYQAGNMINLSANFTDTLGVAVDPTTVTLRVTDPQGVETDYAPQKIAVGQYTYVIQVVLAGFWNYRWEGTGAVYAAQESRFQVATSLFLNPA